MHKSGAQLGEENYQRLKQYFDQLAHEQKEVPVGKNGKPNLSAIALACGFDRQVLYQNPRCQELLETKVAELGGSERMTTATPKTTRNPKDQRIRDLEKQVADLREQLREAQRYQRAYTHVEETGRDVLL